ncbi:hypothetical protein [Nonomuraea sp. NPDC048901]|uniref:hypothetical protein n=1 Tax=Nonomuraea sp. NPDC048901 TaxID=3155627 RepID=UPI0033CE6FA0
MLRLKQNTNADGAIRLQCPAAGTSPSVTCPRFDRLHQRGPNRPAAVDLTNTRQRGAHPAAKPRVLPPRPDLKTDQLPKICRQHTITLHPGDLGHLDKFRQDLAYLSPAWIGTYKPVRANTEGINGRLKGHDLDLGDPKNRLAHGRVAQTILVALLVAVANDHFLDQWRHTHEPQDEPITLADTSRDLRRRTTRRPEQATTRPISRKTRHPTAAPSPPSASPCPTAECRSSTSGLTPPGPSRTPAPRFPNQDELDSETPETTRSRPITKIRRDPVNFSPAVSRTAPGGEFTSGCDLGCSRGLKDRFPSYL